MYKYRNDPIPCPNCFKEHVNNRNIYKNALIDTYGKISRERYNLELGNILFNEKLMKNPYNVGKHMIVEIQHGIIDDVFRIYFFCECLNCGFTKTIDITSELV